MGLELSRCVECTMCKCLERCKSTLLPFRHKNYKDDHLCLYKLYSGSFKTITFLWLYRLLLYVGLSPSYMDWVGYHEQQIELYIVSLHQINGSFKVAAKILVNDSINDLGLRSKVRGPKAVRLSLNFFNMHKFIRGKYELIQRVMVQHIYCNNQSMRFGENNTEN